MVLIAPIARCLSLGIVLLGGTPPAAHAQSAAATSPVVIELFTSEGCDTCPAADAFAGELAGRPDVLVLSFHVDYWDYRGWKDLFAQHAFAERQRAYARTLAQRYVYTPQMVLDGRMQEVGSDRKAIERLLGKIREQERKRLALRQVGRGTPTAIMIENPIGIEIARDKPATVWLVVFDRQQITEVTRGENAGRALPSYNVVRQWKRIGSFAGEPVTIPVDLAISKLEQGSAVLVQTAAGGPILAALPLETE